MSNEIDRTRTEAALREDENARAAALAIESCIVEAPAGAGKTELLTQRFLRLLATVDAPEEVMAITFTNKAAAEMQTRILDNLHAAARGEQPAAPHKQLTVRLAAEVLAVSSARGWHLLEQPGRLRLTTIDALCASLARQMPLLSRFGASPTVTDDALPHYEEAARRTIELLESAEAAYAEPVAAALDYLDNDTGRLRHLLAAMLSRRDQWLHAVSVEQASDRVLTHLVELELAAIRRALPVDWEARLMPAVRFAVETLLANGQAGSPIVALRDWVAPLSASADALPEWRGLAEFLLTGKNEWRKSFTVAVGIPAGKEGKPWKDQLSERIAEAAEMPGLAGLEKALARIRLLPGLDGREAEDAIVGHFSALLKLATAHLWQVFREAGETDFVEVAQRALAALTDDGAASFPAADGGAPSDLALRLDYRIRHLLVDEFQDTSPTQIALLERLTAGWSAGDGRTLFCVGDPMQSIYRFRKADVGLFLRATSEGIGGLPLKRLRLSRNNRSSAPVVDWINGAFATIFPAADEVAKGSIAYRSSAPTRPPMTGAGVAVHLLDAGRVAPAVAAAERLEAAEADDPPAREDIDRAEAARILALIDATWQADRRRDIAVLVRARPHLAPLVGALRRDRPALRFSAVEVEPLAGRQWIADLLHLSHALQHRADRVSWLAVLRSPLCGLTLADLLALAGDDHRRTVPALLADPARRQRLSADGRQRLAVVADEFAAAFAAQGRLPHSRLLEGLWLRLGGPAGLPDAAASRDVDAFFGLVGRLEARGRMNREQLVAELGRLFAAPDGDGGRTGEGRLSLMTIHKSKGLEFDTVILPGLHRTVRGNDPEMLLWEEVSLPGEGAQLIVAPMKPAQGAGGALPSAYDFLRRLEKERGRNEDLRVLYVAATRAIRTLHLVGVVSRKDDGEALPPAGTPLADLWPALSGGERLPRTPEVALDEIFCDRGESLFRSDSRESPRKGDCASLSEPPPVIPCRDSATDAAGLPSWNDFVPKLIRQRLDCFAGLPATVAATVANAAAPVEVAAPPTSAVPADAAPASAVVPVAADEAAVGTLVHRYLELMAEDGSVWPEARLRPLLPAMAAWLARQGVAPANVAAAAERAMCLLCRLGDSPTARWLLADRPGALAESAMLSGDGVAVVDRSFVEANERWIIDYKTGVLDAAAQAADAAGETLRRQRAEAYRAQLDRYGKLFAGESLPQRKAIFFVDGGWLVEL